MLGTLDLLIFELGTNDFADTIGTSADVARTASLHGYIRTALDDLQAHYPTLRIILITPVNIASRATACNAPGLIAVRQAMMEQGTLHGTPCIDNFSNSGFNPLNTPGMLVDRYNNTQLMQTDRIHPAPSSFTYIATGGATVPGVGYATFAAYPTRKLLELPPFTSTTSPFYIERLTRVAAWS